MIFKKKNNATVVSGELLVFTWQFSKKIRAQALGCILKFRFTDIVKGSFRLYWSRFHLLTHL